MKVLMVGVDRQTQGGMWTVAENYLNDVSFSEMTGLKYISTSITGKKSKRVLFSCRALLQIFFTLLMGDYDIVHVHMAEKGSVYRKNLVISIARIFHCKILLHMHGAEFESWYRQSSKRNQAFVRRVLQKADRIVILGEYWRKFIESLAGQRVSVVYNAVTVPEKNFYSVHAKHLLFLGRIEKRKGIYDLLLALQKIDENLDKDIQLWIYGPDPENSMNQVISEMGLNQRVVYRGWLDKKERENIFSQVALNILPSYHEGLPMTILETMAYGIPNISTKVAAIPEVVDSENGVLICSGEVDRLANAIFTLMCNPKMREEKSCRAFDTIKTKFSLTRHLEEILSIYYELENGK